MIGIKFIIVMLVIVFLVKVSVIKGYGVEVVLNGVVYDDVYVKVVEI